MPTRVGARDDVDVAVEVGDVGGCEGWFGGVEACPDGGEAGSHGCEGGGFEDEGGELEDGELGVIDWEAEGEHDEGGF